MKSIDLAKMKKKVLEALDREGGRLQARLSEITSMRNALNQTGGGPVSGNGRKRPSNGRKTKHHTMSAAGRRAIAKAQRLRWRKIREEKS